MKKLIAPLAAVAVALSTLAPLVPADAAPRRLRRPNASAFAG